MCNQVGDMTEDHNMYWGRPEQQPQKEAQGSGGWRPVWVISSSAQGGWGALGGDTG